jgi:hypothetical protein
VSGVSRRVVNELITNRRFTMLARKAKNGFVAGENCFVAARLTKHRSKKFNYFSRMRTAPVDPRGPAAAWSKSNSQPETSGV